MAKIIAFGEYSDKYKQQKFENQLQTEIEKVEEKLGLTQVDEPLLVLTDMQATTIGNCLLDVKNEISNGLKEIDRVLEILGIEECEEFPDE